MGHFAAVAVNDSLTMDFDNRKTFESHHYAFQVGDEEFDAIFARVKAEGLSYSADPFHRRSAKLTIATAAVVSIFTIPTGTISRC